MKKLERIELKNIKGGRTDNLPNGESNSCHSKTGCSVASNNGNFFGNCPTSNLPEGCSCQNYTCPGTT